MGREGRVAAATPDLVGMALQPIPRNASTLPLLSGQVPALSSFPGSLLGTFVGKLEVIHTLTCGHVGSFLLFGAFPLFEGHEVSARD